MLSGNNRAQGQLQAFWVYDSNYVTELCHSVLHLFSLMLFLSFRMLTIPVVTQEVPHYLLNLSNPYYN